MATNLFNSRGVRAAVALLVIAAVVVSVGLVSRKTQARKLDAAVAASGVPVVRLLTPVMGAGVTLELPARIEPWARAPIYSRVSGYLQSWAVDIGTPVKAGQLLATIETPDIDQQLLQAQAELASVRSTLGLAETTAKRWQALRAEDAVSAQEAEEKSGDLSARRAQVQALSANVARMQSMKRYTRLVAPFDGVVTARNTDLGALINVGGGAGSELFVVSDIRRLRVYVTVPQRQVAAIKAGMAATLTVPERPGNRYPATVQSSARAIGAGSGGMLVQLAIDNRAGELLPGAFATLRFDVPAAADGVSVPPGALIYGKDGARLATLDQAGRVLLKPVTLGRDLGTVVQVAGGIEPGDRIIDSPPDGIANGDNVRVAP